MKPFGEGELEAAQLATVKMHADRLLREAGAINVFPTPIDRLMDAAKLTVVDDAFLDEGLLRQFLKKARDAYGTIKSALTKVLGLIHVPERLVLIDKSMPAPKLPFVKLHEAGHGSLPHQVAAYALVQDCEKTLHPEVADLFEREANAFASEVLFQGQGFEAEARQSACGIAAPMLLSTKYGASKYSTFRRYVSTNQSACCVIVLEPAISQVSGGFTSSIRRVITSESFYRIFDPLDFGNELGDKHLLGHLVPTGGRRMTKARSIKLKDRNGNSRSCTAEAFNSTHQVFILIVDNGIAASKILLASAMAKNFDS